MAGDLVPGVSEYETEAKSDGYDSGREDVTNWMGYGLGGPRTSGLYVAGYVQAVGVQPAEVVCRRNGSNDLWIFWSMARLSDAASGSYIREQERAPSSCLHV